MQNTMRTYLIILLPPLLNQYLRFRQRGKYLPVEQFTPQFIDALFRSAVLADHLSPPPLLELTNIITGLLFLGGQVSTLHYLVI